MTAPIQYLVQTAAQAAYVPPQASSADVVALLARNLKLVPSVVGPMSIAVLWSSWAAAQAALPTLDPRVTIVGWGIEKANPGEPLPADEAANIPGWIATARSDATAHGRQLMIVPDDGYALQYGGQIAKTTDLNTVQMQRFQANTTKLNKILGPILGAQAFTNPAARTFVQLYPGDATQGGLAGAQTAWASIGGLAGVVGCGLYNSGTDADWAAVVAFIAGLRPG